MNDDNLIHFFKEDGTPVNITRNEYREKILPDIFESAWNDADQLCHDILITLEDGFEDDCVEPAKRLIEIDPIPERSNTILGLVLINQEKFDEALDHYNNYMQENGEEGAMIANIAKIYYSTNQEELVEDTLWKAINLNADLDNAVRWWAAIQEEKYGTEGYREGLEKISDMENGYYADLYLGQHYLEEENWGEALVYFRKAVNNASWNSDILISVSSELGMAGKAEIIVEWIEPIYELNKHDAAVGLNLLQAYLETGNKEKGIGLIYQLKELLRPDIIESLNHFEIEFNKLES